MGIPSIYNSTFKCYKLSTSTAIHKKLKPLLASSTFKNQLKSLIVEALYTEIQVKRSELLFDDFDEDRSDDLGVLELQELIEIEHFYEKSTASHSVNRVIVRSKDANVLKPQLFLFITNKIDDQRHRSHFNTILMVRATPKISHITLKHLINDCGVLLSQLKISSTQLKNCLNANIGRLCELQSDLELTFGNISTRDNALSNISINLNGNELANWRNSADATGQDLFTANLFHHLQCNTAINFEKLQLSRIQCNLFYLSHDGRVKLFDHSSNSDEKGLSWFILQKLF